MKPQTKNKTSITLTSGRTLVTEEVNLILFLAKLNLKCQPILETIEVMERHNNVFANMQALKQMYGGDMLDALRYTSNPLLNMIPKQDLGGKTYVVPVSYKKK